MKLLHIVGNRPQFVKLATVLRAATGWPEVKNIIVHTGQHYDPNMSSLFFEELGIPAPHHYLGVGPGSSSYQTGLMMQKMDPVLVLEKPDCVMIYGDTNTTLAGALTASMLHFPCAHVESGMREYVRRAEELNRRVADTCCDFLFCPLPSAAANLIKENIPAERIFVTGDVTYDSYLANARLAEKSAILDQVGVQPGRYALLTLHRAETVDIDSKLTEVVSALSEIEQPVVFPVHPRTRKRLIEFSLVENLEKSEHLRLLEPLGYFDLLKLLKYANVAITDSGGVVREAFFAGRPTVSLDVTGGHKQIFKEIFDTGYATIGIGKEGILQAYHLMANKPPAPANNNPFGDGRAAERMLNIILEKMVGA
jgi:UDP-GlcNAc3NAcA epimerase